MIVSRRGVFGVLSGLTAFVFGERAASAEETSKPSFPPIKVTTDGSWIVATYECELDLFERWHPDWRDAVASINRRYSDPNAYQKQRTPFETVVLSRGSNGQLNYGQFEVVASRSRNEALQRHKEALTKFLRTDEDISEAMQSPSRWDV